MIFDGVKLAQKLEAKLKQQVKPGLKLAILVFDDDRAGQVYSRLKQAAGKRLGIEVIKGSDPVLLAKWNQDASIQGIMIQRPGFKGKEKEKQWAQLVNTIGPGKDVDGLRQDSPFTQATVRAVETVLTSVHIPIRNGMLIIGRGMIGKALKRKFKAKNISSQDKNLARLCAEAEILISCSGRQGLIKTVKSGAVVIDVGWPKGDVDFDKVKDKAKLITPVPGGVGPLSVVCLFQNLVKAAEIVYSNSL